MSGVSATGRVWGGVVAALMAIGAAPAFAQFTPTVPAPPPNLFQTQAERPPVVQKLDSANSTQLPPPKQLTPAPGPVVSSPVETLTGPVFSDPPLPGSTEDRYLQELDARRAFTQFTWRGTRITALPNSLLWEPALAVKRDPKMQLTYSDLGNYRGSNTVDTWIGGTQGLFRFEPEGADFAAQWDIFGLVISRLSPDDLIATDYRFGFPLTWRWGWWQGKVAYEHTSAHLGDELIRASGRPVLSWAKDELVIGVGRFIYDDLRVYGHFGYAFTMGLPYLENSTRTRSRFDVGAEWFNRCPTGWAGSPFAAVNLEWRGDQGFVPNWTFQAGWLWRNPFMREGMIRVFAEHYRGQSPYGHFFRERERYSSVGFGFDY
jgi:Protein of unknown function (DUF1207)